MNTLFVLLDGMEDDPNPHLNGKKPYEVAKMPFLYSKAKHKMYTTGRGYTQLYLNEFFTGYPPDTSRAALEAQGFGLDMKNGRTAYRLSPAYINNGMIHWAYGMNDADVENIVISMKKHLHLLDKYDPDIRFFTSGRAVLTIQCDNSVDYPAPPVDAPYKEVPGELKTVFDNIAKDMNGLTYNPWGVGKLGKQYPPFPCIENMTAVSDSPTALGVAAALGHKTYLINNVDERFPVAKEALKHGHVFLHIDEVDEYSHEKDHNKKIKILEHTDELMSEYFSDEDNIVYFVDHGTSCVTGEHILMTVPFWTSIETDMKDGDMIPLDQIVKRILKQN
ncbi:MAG: phosphoglycerate mutase [Candidatus Methanomethylophilaceae archaeon]|nr:phosphoglycerate mutase [Candidatus Methanomethylophilaceae archaeon]MDD3379016.1 phosphoglycerate mutase [Candidatus Methanomethylophilaceae archaeon]MDY0224718.1 phosphoglycerate mutase [Candidatus Methanomethylophilaceae archaeon]